MRRHPILSGCAVIMVIGFMALIVIAVLSRSPFVPGKTIAVVELKGVIMDSREIVEELEDHRTNDAISAVVLRIDSPGGGVAPSQEIYAKVRVLDKEKPVIASMGSIAASGGYYAALGARKIVANSGTITGSIGVIIEIPNMEGLMSWAKISHEVIKSGTYKDIGSPLRSLKDDERKRLQEFVDDIFKQFVAVVEKRRKLTNEEVLKLADGMIFSGSQALDLGLVDELGTMSDAVKIAAREAGIEGEPTVIYPSPPSFWEKMLDSKTNIINGIIPWDGIRAMYIFRL